MASYQLLAALGVLAVVLVLGGMFFLALKAQRKCRQLEDSHVEGLRAPFA